LPSRARFSRRAYNTFKSSNKNGNYYKNYKNYNYNYNYYNYNAGKATCLPATSIVSPESSTAFINSDCAR